MPIKEFFLDLLFPRVCVACRRTIATGAICDACEHAIVPQTALFCGECRARVPGPRKICHKDFPCLMGAAGDYENPALRSLVHALKFNYIDDAAEPLGRYIAAFASTLPIGWGKFSIIPIPLSARRLRERGYNQAERIAETVAERMRVPLLGTVLIRTAHAPPQSHIKDRDARAENVRGCFAVNAPAVPRHILLIDDVVTSGATFAEAARTLKKHGAATIIALAAARA